MTLKEELKQLVEDLYKQKGTGSTQDELVDIIWKKKKLSKPKTAKTTVQPAVSRALKDLIENKDVMKIDGNLLLPYNAKVRQKKTKTSIIESRAFTRYKYFKASDSVIYLDIQRGRTNSIGELFKEYLGSDCFDFYELGGYLVLMLEADISNFSTDEKEEENTENQNMKEEDSKNPPLDDDTKEKIILKKIRDEISEILSEAEKFDAIPAYKISLINKNKS